MCVRRVRATAHSVCDTHNSPSAEKKKEHAQRDTAHGYTAHVHLAPVHLTHVCTSVTHSFTHSLIHSFTHSLIHSFTHSLIHSFTQCASRVTVQHDTNKHINHVCVRAQPPRFSTPRSCGARIHQACTSRECRHLGSAQGCPHKLAQKRWEAKRVSKWSCESFSFLFFVLRDDDFKFLFCPRGRACRVALNAEGHKRKSARAERSKFRYTLRESALGKGKSGYMVHIVFLARYVSQGVFYVIGGILDIVALKRMASRAHGKLPDRLLELQADSMHCSAEREKARDVKETSVEDKIMDCSRKTPSQSLASFRVVMRTKPSLRYH